MKNTLLTSILSLWVSFAWAQADNEVTIENLQIPNSPAFILLDEAPTAIDRPATSKALALGLIDALNGNTILPKNYAAEFTPYWYFKHDSLTALKYIGIEPDNFWTRMGNNISKASVSLAFVNKTADDAVLPIHHFSIGARTNLISIWTEGDKKDVRNKYAQAVQELADLDSIQGILPPVPTGDYAAYAIAMQQYQANLQAQLESWDISKSALSVSQIQKPVFALDLAAGYNEFFLNNDIHQNHFGRFGIWMTANYSRKLCKSSSCYLNIYAAGKYLKTGTTLEQGEYVQKEFYDAGFKIELECKRLTFSYEYLKRLNDQENTTRSNGLIRYKISDKVYLTGAFGKNFGDTANLISFLGINWGFSTGEEKTVVP